MSRVRNELASHRSGVVGSDDPLVVSILVGLDVTFAIEGDWSIEQK